VINKKQNRLSRRLLIYVLLCSSALTLIVTCIQLFIEYQKDFELIQKNLQLFNKSYVPVLTFYAYNLDDSQMRIQMRGALQLSGVKYIQFMVGGKTKIEEGNPKADQDVVWEIPLKHSKLGADPLFLGTLIITVSYKEIHQRLAERITIVVLTNAAKTFLAAFCIFVLIQVTITRHLNTMANHARKLNSDQLNKILDLNRTRINEPDELDEVVIAINEMQVELKKAFNELRYSEEKYRELLERLNDAAYRMSLPDGKYEYFSRAAQRVFGYDSEKWLSKAC
jgi:methyl-accepting chemotaxis protein